MERSELVAEALGEHVFEYFIRNKRAEWADYKAQVTPCELDRYLAIALRRPSADDGTPAASSRTRRRRCSRQTLDLAGYPWKAVTNASIAAQRRARRRLGRRGRVRRRRPRGCVRHLPGAAQARQPLEPVLLLVVAARSSASSSCARTSSTTSASRRSTRRSSRPGSRHLFWRTGRGTRPELVEYGDLVLNLETYQAALGGRPLDLTYMEYELLKFFATHPGKVFTREQLLSRVWGYEYYGGARTVDVHVRRLRAKLGEEHANLIQTVRSVGYRFGSARWSPGDSALGSGGPGRLGPRRGGRRRRRAATPSSASRSRRPASPRSAGPTA